MTSRKRTPPVILDHSDEEEARIQQMIADDPDTWEHTDGSIEDIPTPPVRRARSLGLPEDTFLDERGRLRARPDLAHSADPGIVPTQLTLDLDVADALRRSDPDNWEDRANEVLRKAVGL